MKALKKTYESLKIKEAKMEAAVLNS